jgi:site-specific DNA-methyltransferase (adenine-specific)
MVKNYTCEKCGKTFKQKGHYTKHLQRKTPCKPIENKVIEEKVKGKIQELSENGDIEIKNENLISNNKISNIVNMNDIKLFNCDCMEEMKNINKNSVNAIITDLPYGVSQNNWDTPLDLDKMWNLFKNILCEDGIIILTASGKFTARLMMSNIDMFKYDIIWEKTVNSGQLNVNRMPLRSHENILIFYNKNRTYNEQKTKGEPYKIIRKNTNGDGYGNQKSSDKTNKGYRHARSVIKISNPRKKGGHPTQKPVELMEYLIKAYTNEGDTVLDCCMGCGSTGIAAVKNNRKFIGIEIEKKYFDTAFKDITDQSELK